MLTQEELKNLEIIFSLARQSVVDNEKALIDVINFKKILFDKYTPKVEEKKEEVKTETK